jgi:hypothetical protein
VSVSPPGKILVGPLDNLVPGKGPGAIGGIMRAGNLVAQGCVWRF